jgi:MFS family permease
MPFQMWGLEVKQALATSQFWMLSLFFYAGFTLFVIVTHMIPQIIQLGFTIDEPTGFHCITTSANIMAVFVALQAVGSIVFEAFIDKIGSKAVQAISFILLAAALFWLACVDSLGGFWGIAAISGFAIGGTAATQSTKAVEPFGIRRVGILMGLLTLMYCITWAVGPVVTAAMQDAGAVTNDFAWAVYPYTGTWILTGIMGVLGLLSVLVLRPLKNPEATPRWLRHQAASPAVAENLAMAAESTEA